MKILEIKNSLVKISYDVEDNLALSGFAIIEDVNTPYVAQVVNLKAENGRNYAVLKLLFTFDNEGVLKSYNGTIPSLEATVTKLPSDELLSILPMSNPVYLGELAQQETAFKLDSSVLESNLLICSNNVDNTSKLLSNILPQLVEQGKKTVLLDVNGDFSSDENFIFGKNFKLPLNAQFLDYIFENDLEGVEPVSKAVVQDIFKEVQDYIKELPQGYLPLDLFINVVQDQYQETGIAELVLLKNKLLKYQELNVFASGSDDVNMFRDKVAHSDSLIVDVSNVELKLQKVLIPYLFDCIATVNSDTFVLITMNNDVADKKLLRKTLEFKNIYTTIVCGHEFRYLPDLKQIIQNLVLFAPQTLQHDFANYNTFLSKLNAEEFVVYGPATQNVPFIVQVKPYEELVETDDEVEEEVDETEEAEETIEAVETPETEEEEVSFEPTSPFETDEEIGLPTDDNEVSLDEAISYTEPEFIQPEEENAVEDYEVPSFEDVTDETPSFDEQPEFYTNEELESVDETEYDAEEVPTFEQEALEDREVLEEQVAKDIDASFYKKIEEETLDSENEVNPDVLLDDGAESELSESDLDFIQSLPMDEEEQEVYSTEEFAQDDLAQIEQPVVNDVLDDEIIEELAVDETDVFEEDTAETEESQIVPIYTPEEIVESVEDAPIFESGDVVSHPKYGQGVVEKMINYGNKALCSISFVNIGRRLLDPSLSDLTLVSRDGINVN